MTSVVRSCISAVLATLALILLLPFAWGQETVSLTGVVSDKTGAVVQDATVKLVDTKTDANWETKTNSVGAYTFLKLLPGPGYKLTVNHAGFETLTVAGIYLGVGATRTQNIQLELGQVSETVEVSAADQVVSLDTTDTVVGNNVDMRSVRDLPINARESPLELMDLQPGVIDTNSANDDNGSRGGAVSGARTDQNNVTLDGLDVNDFATGQAFVTNADAPVDSVQEFRAETANPLAASGRGSGAQVQLVTKSGTNHWHGSAFDYLRNTATEANTFFNDRNGVEKPKLIRNSFGANLGGPAVKDKLFFFFEYNGRRDHVAASPVDIVPLDSYRTGIVNFINSGANCTNASRLNTQPNCISPAANLNTLDPAGTGPDQNLLTFLQSRYPHVNDVTLGDGVNTGGFHWNAPVSRTINDYVARIDYNLTSKMKLFGRVSILRDFSGDDVNFQAPEQFPGDPTTHMIDDTSSAFVIGHTWTINSNMVNQFYAGETTSRLNFPTLFSPAGVDNFNVFGPITVPFSSQQSQHRIIPVPIYRDDFTYNRGRHTIQMGGTFKNITSQSNQVSDYHAVNVGLGVNLTNLSANERPNGLLADPVAQNQWDQDFTFALGRFAAVNTNVNYSAALQPLPPLTGHTRHYRYYETEAYLQDTFKMRSDLTLTYGLRWQYYSVPYEINGFEATPDLNFRQFLTPRLQLGPQGLAGPLPITTYSQAGKANHQPGLYEPDLRDFAPRLSFAYNPSAKGGPFGRLFGDRKTVIRGGGGVVFDHPVTNAFNFIQDQASYLFQNVATTNSPGDLATDFRFVDLATLPTLAPPPVVTPPFAPFTFPGLGPIGAALGQANYAIDPTIKTPYNITFTFGFQRELPGNFLLESTYFARLGRRLLVQADAGQVIDFKDPTSGHFLAADFADLSKQLRAGANPQTTLLNQEPFFENQIGTANCQGIGLPSCTQLVGLGAGTLVFRGDLGDTIQLLDSFPFFQGLPGLPLGVGLDNQFGTNAFITNQGSSSYNGLLTTLHKRFSHNFQFDFNYTYSHSIDNGSATANNVFGTTNFAGGLLCDVLNLRTCRGNSEFDVTHIIGANGIWDIPIGKGQRFGSAMPRWLDETIGGWQISGEDNWHSGFAFTSVANAFPISFSDNAPAIFDGDAAAIKTHIHTDPSTGQLQLFANPAAAQGAFSGPLGLQAGSRDNLRGPRFSNLNLGLAKHFGIREGLTMTFRADAFNVFNHPNFDLPGLAGNRGTADITNPGQFGVITGTAASRQMQFALRLDF